MSESCKDFADGSMDEEFEIKVIGCKLNDKGKELYQVQETKCFWIGEGDIEKYKEYVDQFVTTLKRKSQDKKDESSDELQQENGGSLEKAKKDATLKRSPGPVSLQVVKEKDGRYYCLECPKSFKRPFDYRMHQKTHSGTNPHYCETCESFFSRASKLMDHYRTQVHKRKVLERGVPGTQEWSCNSCSDVFETEEEMTSHLKEKHGQEPASKRFKSDDKANSSDGDGSKNDGDVDKTDGESDGDDTPVFNCDACNLKFTEKLYLDQHLGSMSHRERKKKTKDLYLCPECEYHFQSWAIMKDHLEKKHQMDSNDDKARNCKKCDISFDSKSRWIAHLSTKKHSRSANSIYKASCCDKTFKTEKACFNHERVHLRTSPYHCELCDRYFLKRHHLSSHTVSCHSSDRPYACPYCTRSFKTSHQLETHLDAGHNFQCVTCEVEFNCKPHLKKHLQDSPSCVQNVCYRCNNMRFTTEEEFQQHKQEIHKRRMKKTFTCSDCGKTYCEAFKLRQHMTWHTTGRYPFQCDSCSVICYKKSKLERHVNSVHLNIYDFECQECRATFKTKHHLDEHKYELHSGQGYVCQICDKTLFTQKTYEAHQLSHTKMNSFVNKDEFDLRSLTNLSMGLDSTEGSMKTKVNNSDTTCKQGLRDALKIPSIMTSEKHTLAESDSEDTNEGSALTQMEIAEAISVVTSQNEEIAPTSSHDQDIVTPRFKIIAENLSGGLEGPVTIKVAQSFTTPNPDGSLNEITPDTIQQLKSTLSDLLSLKLQEQSSANEGNEQSGSANQNKDEEKTVEIILVPNTDDFQEEQAEEGEEEEEEEEEA